MTSIEQRDRVVKVFDFGAEGSRFNSCMVEPKNLFPSLFAPLLHLTMHGAGAVDDKDLAVSSSKGNAWLFVHPYIIARVDSRDLQTSKTSI